jgi:hypothetical protein
VYFSVPVVAGEGVGDLVHGVALAWVLAVSAAE